MERTLYWLGYHSSRGMRFALVGLSGVLVNSATLWALAVGLGLPIFLASTLATEVAIISNFLLNDRWTFNSGPHRYRLLERFVRYNLVALGGMVVTVTLLLALTMLTAIPLLAANLLAVMGAVGWNYLISSTLAWRTAAMPPLTAQIWGLWRRFRLPLAWLAVILALTWVVVVRPGGWGIFAALLLGLALVISSGRTAFEVRVFTLAVGTCVATLNYLSWRAGQINWHVFWIAVPLFLAELLGAAHTLGLQYTIWPRPKPKWRHNEDPTLRPIFILIPTVDEGPGVLEPTIRGALQARERYLATYPHGRVEIVVCNDGLVAGKQIWRETEALAAKLGVRCVTRTQPGGAKAGNLEYARQQVGATGEALIVIFDADQVAQPEFLLRMIPPLADSTVGWVQSGQYYRNLENPVARWANDQQALFYSVLCPGKSALNAAFICGTNVVLRAAALDEIGGFSQDSVTEDFAASIDLHPRWRSIFVRDVLVTGLGPMDLQAYFKQQRRWATGTLGVLRSHWRAIFLPVSSGLTLAQRLQYGLACTHYLCGVRDLVYIIAPILFLLTGLSPVRGAFLSDFVWHFLPYWMIAQIAFWNVARGKSGWRGIVIGFASFPVLVASLWTVVMGRRMGFTVTAKRRLASSPIRQIWPHLLAICCCLAALGAAIGRDLTGPVLVSALWVLYSTMMLIAVIWLGILDTRARGASGHAPLSLQRQLTPIRSAGRWRPVNVSVALVLSLGLMTSGTSTLPAQAFVPAREEGAPLLGVSLPYTLLADRPDEIASALGQPLGIVARTQDINDRFDRSWAARLAARGTRPALTLLFGLPGQANLDSSLPAIANGIHDEQIRRWAREMRAYGGPIYFIVLPHVDRNWAVTSAVAQGGIPQDVPRAWYRIHNLLREEGAVNVALVWAPADPANDHEYAPPSDLVDAVMLSLISYPGTSWSDPAVALQNVALRHPNVPLLLEVSASGPPEMKASWLRKVVDAAAHTPELHALLYHEGSPSPYARLTDHAAWSLLSDPESLAAMREAVNLMRDEQP